MEVSLTGHDLKIETVVQIAHGQAKVKLAESARLAMTQSRRYITDRIASGEVMYGINTGFGAFSSVRIEDAQLEELQRNLIRSHCMGVGPAFSREQTRAIMVLRANALARGHSGIRPDVVEKILEFLAQGILPVIPEQGSVGASGDLAPLSHLALALIGEGEAWAPVGAHPAHVPVTKLLQEKKVQPLVLQAKEGLSLINGCQVMTAVGILAAHRARHLLWMADVSGALSLEALRGSRQAFNPLIAATRAHPGEAKTAGNLRKLLGETSPIAESHANCGKVQDAYSLRCMPAVHGAAKDALRYVWNVLETEANSSTDNPLVFAKEGEVLSCGNFHGEPVAFAMDFAAIAISALANISECRIEKMMNTNMSELPAFLAPNGGLNSGHMIVQVAAASLVSENKILAHPASVDSIPTSADKEDHVSMGTIAARKFQQIVSNAENVVSMEFLSATQAIDMLKPLELAGALKSVHQTVRKHVPFAEKDRVFANDVQKLRELVTGSSILDICHSSFGHFEF